MPAISIIVPVYNVQGYIGRCIESILGQTFADFELILVDDGSTDGSGRICADFVRRDSRVTLLENDHKGVSAARNAGLDAARGRYIAFIDSDDCVHPRYLEVLYNGIVESSYDISVANYRNFETIDTAALYAAGTVVKEAVSVPEQQIMYGLCNVELMSVIWGKLYSREVIGENRFRGYAIIEDLEFNSRVYRNGVGIGFIDTELYFRQVRNGSLTHSKFSANDFDNIEASLQAYLNIADRCDLYTSYILIRLYKNMLSTRYWCTPQYRDELNGINDRVFSLTIRTFARNRHISPVVKYSLLAFMRLPLAYGVFMRCMSILNSGGMLERIKKLF